MAKVKEPDESKGERVIRMYGERTSDGRRKYTMADITRETGVPRATCYWLLNQAGIRPDRQRGAAEESGETFDFLLDRYNEVIRENAILTAQVARYKGALDYLFDRLGITPSVAHKLTNATHQAPAAPRRQPPSRQREAG